MVGDKIKNQPPSLELVGDNAKFAVFNEDDLHLPAIMGPAIDEAAKLMKTGRPKLTRSKPVRFGDHICAVNNMIKGITKNRSRIRRHWSVRKHRNGWRQCSRRLTR